MTGNRNFAPPAEIPEADEIRQQEETNTGVARATGVIATGNITSRVLGLARETVLTNLFGASAAVDAFNIAVLIPKAFYDLLIGGHVNSALVPVLSEAAARDEANELWPLVSVLVSFVLTIVTILAALLAVFAPQIVMMFPSDESPETLVIAAQLLRLTAPALVFLSLFAVLSGTLYALRSFTWPAFAGATFNAAIVSVTVLTAPAIGITGAALGWLIGAVAQFALQLPGLRGARLSLTFRWNHPAMRQILLLYAPVMFSLIIDTLVIRLFSFRLASTLGVGSISYMIWATTLIQFPQGLVATAISIAILPTLSRQTAEKNPFRDTLGLGLRLATVLIIPATIGLFVLATPIVDLIFEHGAFTAADTTITVMALRLYLIGLPFAAVDLLLVYAFYARQDTLTPALIGLLSLTVYMIMAVSLLPRYGLFSLMIADTVKHFIHACVAAYLLRRRLNGLGKQRLWLTTMKTLLAAAVMGWVGYWISPPLGAWIGVDGLINEIFLVSLSGIACLLAFAMMAWILRLDELRWILSLLKTRLTS